jgi:hypothetical protein
MGNTMYDLIMDTVLPMLGQMQSDINVIKENMPKKRAIKQDEPKQADIIWVGGV